MKAYRNLVIMIILIIVLLISSLLAYRFLYNAYEKSHVQERKILFYNLKNQTSELLTKLHHDYIQVKSTIVTKHKIVESYLEKHSHDENLTNIYNIINDGLATKPYDIYITNSNLVIMNTTFLPDLGFDLSFAKNIFEKHKKEKLIEPCSPLFEKVSKGFMTYSDSYLVNEGGKNILQISYRYDEAKELFQELQEALNGYHSILELKAYIFLNNGFINDMIFHNYTKYKPKLDEIESRIKDGGKIAKELGENELYIEEYRDEAIPYQVIYLKTKSPILKNTFTIYRLTFDEGQYYQKLRYLNMMFLILCLIGFVAMIVIFHLWNHENFLKEQDQFVKSAMHEIRTPLSIITLNHELRDIDYGVNEYSQEIDGALKTLQNSYDDMSFILMNQKIDYTIESLNLKKIVQERVLYFSSIANSNEKKIEFTVSKNQSCFIDISYIELIRLIDNNLSNGIKYSHRGTTITVRIENNILTFHSIGEVIKDSQAIFKKYRRENEVVGGYGLGLSIVDDITKKYKIKISLDSTKEFGTTFCYTFKCHTNIISKG